MEHTLSSTKPLVRGRAPILEQEQGHGFQHLISSVQPGRWSDSRRRRLPKEARRAPRLGGQELGAQTQVPLPTSGMSVASA